MASEKDNPVIPPEHVDESAVQHAILSLGKRLRMDMAPDTQILTPAAIGKIEARLARCLDNKDQSRLAEASILIAQDIPALCATVKQLRREVGRLTAKYQDYERGYILPCFTWAEGVGFDLREAVKNNPGHNCVELLVLHLQSQLEQLRAENERLRDTFAALDNCQNKPVCGHCNALLRASR